MRNREARSDSARLRRRREGVSARERRDSEPWWRQSRSRCWRGRSLPQLSGRVKRPSWGAPRACRSALGRSSPATSATPWTYVSHDRFHPSHDPRATRRARVHGQGVPIFSNIFSRSANPSPPDPSSPRVPNQHRSEVSSTRETSRRPRRSLPSPSRRSPTPCTIPSATT